MNVAQPLDPPRRKTRRKSLLVVEDEKLIRWSIREALRADYSVRMAASGEAGLQVLRKLKRLDAVLVDIKLPGMDGLEFVRRARERFPVLKVILMTAYNHETAARHAFGVRADAYLPKPFEFRILRDLLASHL